MNQFSQLFDLIKRSGSATKFRSQIANFSRSNVFKNEVHSSDLADMHKPTNMEKRMLVWGKMYKAMEDVPERVSAYKIRKAKDLFRVRVNIVMVIATVGGCIAMIISGRKLREEGDSLEKRGLQWQQDMQRKGQLEREQKKGAEV